MFFTKDSQLGKLFDLETGNPVNFKADFELKTLLINQVWFNFKSSFSQI